MGVEENKALVRRWAEELWNDRKLAVIDELYGDTVIIHDPSGGQEVRGDRALVKRRHERLWNALPDFRMTVEDVIAEGEKVVVRWSGRGTQKGELSGVPPTGKEVRVAGINILRLQDGKIVERWGNTDEVGLLRQLGVEPVPEENGG